jgi:hypothetical protein
MPDLPYEYYALWSEEDHEFVGLCRQFQYLSWLAETPEEALKGIRELVESLECDCKLTLSHLDGSGICTVCHMKPPYAVKEVKPSKSSMSKDWQCSKCGRIYSFIVPSPVPLPCTCGSIYFATVANTHD